MIQKMNWFIVIYFCIHLDDYLSISARREPLPLLSKMLQNHTIIYKYRNAIESLLKRQHFSGILTMTLIYFDESFGIHENVIACFFSFFCKAIAGTTGQGKFHN